MTCKQKNLERLLHQLHDALKPNADGKGYEGMAYEKVLCDLIASDFGGITGGEVSAVSKKVYNKHRQGKVEFRRDSAGEYSVLYDSREVAYIKKEERIGEDEWFVSAHHRTTLHLYQITKTYKEMRDEVLKAIREHPAPSPWH